MAAKRRKTIRFNADKEFLSRCDGFRINRKPGVIISDYMEKGFDVEYLWTVGHYQGINNPRFKELREMCVSRPFIRNGKRRSIVLCKDKNTAEKAAMMLANFRTTDLYPEYIIDEKRLKKGLLRDEDEEGRTGLLTVSAADVMAAMNKYAEMNNLERISGDFFEGMVPEGFENLMIEIRDEKCLEIANILLVLCRDIPNLIVWIGPSCKDPEKIIKKIRWDHGDFDLFRINELTEEDLVFNLREAADFFKIKLLSPLNESELISRLRSYRGNDFSEDDIDILLHKFLDKKDLTLEAALGSDGILLKIKDLNELLKEPFPENVEGEFRMICRDNVTEKIDSMVARINMNRVQKLRGYKAPFHHNFAFLGNPGTGKTVSARYLAEKLKEIGVSNGVFIEASPNKLIGQYIGQTGPKTDELCQKARGGVLFIDEAGLLVPSCEKDYSNQAVQSLLKHMEDESDTTFIFATYPEKMKELIKADPGLKSRISNFVEFEDYSEEELIEIFKSMLGDQGYRIEEDDTELMDDLKNFIASERENLKEMFGNARVMRTLSEKAIENYSIMLGNEHGRKLGEFINDSYSRDELLTIPADCIKEAAKRMNTESETMDDKEEYGFKLPIGF